ncbi:zeta toxin family protein [Kribbella sp. NPDC002412]
MLGSTGFVRSYPIGRPGDVTAKQVSVRIRAELTDEADNLGAVDDVVTIIQRYLYEERGHTWNHGRSSGLGLDGSFGAGSPADANLDTAFDPGRSGAISTDQSQGLSTTEAEQLTRLERMATFDGVTRVERGLRLTIEVAHDSAAPTRGAIARGLAPAGNVIKAPPRHLEGRLVQLVPSKLAPSSTGTAARPSAAVPGPVELPATYVVEGIGSKRVQSRDLLAVVTEWLARKDLLGPVGVRMHQAALENKLSASARHATFSRMASDEGFGLDPLHVPGYKQETVHVGVRARVSDVELVAGPFKGELGDVSRAQQTVSTSSTSGRPLPVAGEEALSATSEVKATLGAGDQLTDTTTDVWGSRRERSRFETGNLVTVRVRVDYDLHFTRTRIRRDGSEQVVEQHPVPGATSTEAYLTLHEHDYQAMIGNGPPTVRSPEIDGTRYVVNREAVEEGALTPDMGLLSAVLTKESDYGGLITGDPDPRSGRAVVVWQGNVRQYFSVRIAEVDSGMAFTELHEGTESDPHVVTFAPGVPVDQLPRVWVHEISHSLQELASAGEGPLQRLTGALTTDGENACVDAQYNEFRYLVRQWYEAESARKKVPVNEIRRDAEGLARAIEARGYRPPAIPWLTELEEDQLHVERHLQVIPPIPPSRPPGTPPRIILLDGPPGADLRTTQARLLAALEFDGWASFDGEDNKTVHPRYTEIMRDWGTVGQELISTAIPRELAFFTLEHLLEADPPYDVVVRHPVGRLDNTAIQIATLQPHGCRVSIAYVATNESQSLLGMAATYQRARDADAVGGTWYGREWHDLVYGELPDTVHALEAYGMVDDIYILTPDGDVLYENHQDADGNWEREFGAREAFVAERDRPPTPLEREQFQRTADELLDGRAGLPPLDDVVEQAVLDAIGRELARPEPRPDRREFGADDKIENRLRGTE